MTAPTQTLAEFHTRFPSIPRIASEISALSTTWGTRAETAVKVRRLARELQTASGELLALGEELEADAARCGGEEVERTLREVMR